MAVRGGELAGAAHCRHSGSPSEAVGGRQDKEGHCACVGGTGLDVGPREHRCDAARDSSSRVRNSVGEWGWFPGRKEGAGGVLEDIKDVSSGLSRPERFL